MPRPIVVPESRTPLPSEVLAPSGFGDELLVRTRSAPSTYILYIVSTVIDPYTLTTSSKLVMFYEGAVQNGIATALQTRKSVVCFVTGI